MNKQHIRGDHQFGFQEAVSVRFTKMEGLGNDYIYINNLQERIPRERFPDLAIAVSDRHFGVGADGLIAILPPYSLGHDFQFQMFNADGSESEMCGNGMRCFARYCYDRGLTSHRCIRVLTPAGLVIPEVMCSENGAVTGVRVDMGEPRLHRHQIPMLGPADDRVLDEPFDVCGQHFRISLVSMGNPHVIIFTDDPQAVDLGTVGPQVEHHPAFPRRTNVHVVRVVGRQMLQMRTWERGSGITLACGTGACAALVASHLMGYCDRTALVQVPGGELLIEWDERSDHVYKTGPANYVCDGQFLRGGI